MKNDKKITKITIRVEFDAYGRTGWVQAETDLETLSNPILIRRLVDAHIDHFFLTQPDPRLPVN